MTEQKEVSKSKQRLPQNSNHNTAVRQAKKQQQKTQKRHVQKRQMNNRKKK